MHDSAAVPAALDTFFRRWEASGAAERANDSMFWNEHLFMAGMPRKKNRGRLVLFPAKRDGVSRPQIGLRRCASSKTDFAGPLAKFEVSFSSSLR